MKHSAVAKRFFATVLALAVVLITVPPVGAVAGIFGTIQVTGQAWVASEATDWSVLSRTRPLVAGDHFKTGSDGYLLADLGSQGVVGLYGGAEITANDSGSGPVIDVLKGKVAFHLSPTSAMTLTATGAGISSGKAAADGYVEIDAAGKSAVVVEQGSLKVQIAGLSHEVKRGERLELSEDAEPVRLAGAEAGAAAASGTTIAGLSTTALTAIGVVAVGVGAAAAAGGDNVASPSD